MGKPINTTIDGVFQSDLFIRSALTAAIADLRANPYYLNFVFAAVNTDAKTATLYGQKEVDKFITWFQKTSIPVVMAYNPVKVEIPCISIGLMSADEVENTLGDVNYHVSESNDRDWQYITPLFNATSYSSVTGALTVPTTVAAAVIFAPNMLLLDKFGRTYPILSVSSDNTAVFIAPGITSDFNNAQIRAQKPSYGVAIEGAFIRETYQIGCHIQGEPYLLMYLWSLTKFMLFRYRQSLLEARGMERTSLSSGQLTIEEGVYEQQIVYSRYITMTGFSRCTWPKYVLPLVTGVRGGSTDGSGLLLVDYNGENSTGTPAVPPNGELWYPSKPK